ncbi:MAG: hypothetical protein HON65_06860 [Rhodospirillales bacterium]|jgi:hypothetical protein|nr:hypothetical protein [Rhodospirillales bacterium]
MKTIRISGKVWDAIAGRGKFGETEDDVLRRVFDLPPAEHPVQRARGGGRVGRGDVRYSTKRMSAKVESNKLIVEFGDGARCEWATPNRGDKAEIRRIREEAVAFALDNGATDPGQTNTVRKALTSSGFHLTK